MYLGFREPGDGGTGRPYTARPEARSCRRCPVTPGVMWRSKSCSLTPVGGEETVGGQEINAASGGSESDGQSALERGLAELAGVVEQLRATTGTEGIQLRARLRAVERRLDALAASQASTQDEDGPAQAAGNEATPEAPPSPKRGRTGGAPGRPKQARRERGPTSKKGAGAEKGAHAESAADQPEGSQATPTPTRPRTRVRAKRAGAGDAKAAAKAAVSRKELSAMRARKARDRRTRKASAPVPEPAGSDNRSPQVESSPAGATPTKRESSENA